MLVAATPSVAAIAHVQVVSCIASASASCTTTPVTTTNGNLFIATSSYCCDAFVSVTDSKLNTYGNAVPEAAGGSALMRQDFIANGVGGASHTFTLTGGSSSFFGTLSVSEISGASSSPLDKIASATDGGTSHTTGNTATTTQADELLLGGGGSASPTTYTNDGGAGWTEQTNISTDASTEGLITGTRIVSATGAYAYTYTTGSSVTTVQIIGTYKASGSRQRCIGCGTDKKVIGDR